MMKQLLLILCVTFVFCADAATLSEAKIAIRTQNFDKAVSILKPLARKGDKEAQYQLAVMYRNGQGTQESPSKSAYWMDKSARQGYERAQFSLGVF